MGSAAYIVTFDLHPYRNVVASRHKTLKAARQEKARRENSSRLNPLCKYQIYQRVC